MKPWVRILQSMPKETKREAATFGSWLLARVSNEAPTTGVYVNHMPITEITQPKQKLSQRPALHMYVLFRIKSVKGSCLVALVPGQNWGGNWLNSMVMRWKSCDSVYGMVQEQNQDSVVWKFSWMECWTVVVCRVSISCRVPNTWNENENKNENYFLNDRNY